MRIAEDPRGVRIPFVPPSAQSPMTDSRSVAATPSRFCAKPPGPSSQPMVGLPRRASNTRFDRSCSSRQVHRNGETVPLLNAAPVIIEFEIAYKLGRDIPGEAKFPVRRCWASDARVTNPVRALRERLALAPLHHHSEHEHAQEFQIRDVGAPGPDCEWTPLMQQFTIGGCSGTQNWGAIVVGRRCGSGTTCGKWLD
jgi:hypothetical protein